MNVNIVLVLLLYKIIMSENLQKKYILVFAGTLFVVSAMFIYFEFFSHSYGTNIYDEIYNLALSLSQDGNSVNDSLLKHEILGLDVFDDEYWYHHLNYFELPFFLVLYSPFIGIFIKCLVKICKKQNNRKNRIATLFAIIGVFTVLPEVVLKVDYGRYVFAVLLYYSMLVLSLMIIDNHVKEAVCECGEELKKISFSIPLLLLYAFMFVPFRAVRISDVVNEITYFAYGFH